MGLQQITETFLVPGIDPPNGKPVFEFADHRLRPRKHRTHPRTQPGPYSLN